jgi:hypothetical protein
MTREEAKQILPLLQAYAEGKEIQLCNNGVWQDAKYQIPFDNITPDEIRVKPEPTYRAFESQEECWAEMQKHQPFGWLEDDRFGESHLLVCYISDNYIRCYIDKGTREYNYSIALTRLTFADGTPFGIKVED